MTVHFVGAGPGAADLITLRAGSLLAAADVVLYPGTYLDAAVLSHCPDAQHVDTVRAMRSLGVACGRTAPCPRPSSVVVQIART